MEWRSLNLTGIKTWEELFEFYSIVWDCLEEIAQDFKGKRVFDKKKITINFEE